MADNKLVLHPFSNTFEVQNWEKLPNELRSIGFISEEFDYFGDTHFRIGERFTELLNFTAINQAIVFDENHSGDMVLAHTMCHIQFLKFDDVINPHGLVNEYFEEFEDSECPKCRRKNTSLAKAIPKYTKAQGFGSFSCRGCGATLQAHELIWPTGIAFTKVAIDIWGIHFEEAYPSHELLNFLKERTGIDWWYFYFRF